MTFEGKIEPALEKIASLFVEQCSHGAQAQDIDSKYAACGQFMGPQAKHRSQRGLHGTAAAIRVLAQCNLSGAGNLVPKLVGCIKDGERVFQHKSLAEDQQNVIKLSEILYALVHVSASQCHTDTIVQDIANKLLGAQKEDKGWTFFLNVTSPIHILPSAFAILALSKHRYDSKIEKHVEFLKESVLNSDTTRIADINEAAVRIFCIFALAFRKDDLPPDEVKELKGEFIRLWKQYEGLLAQDLEQNIEYWNGSENYYVRIPWQLYLLALAARLDSKRLWSLAAQRRLNTILDAVVSSGFRYPYSGDPISSRTNAILFDVLEKIKRRKRWGLADAIFYVCDCIRTFLSRPIFSWLTLIIVLLIGGYCLFTWLTNRAKPEDLGPELSGAVMVLVITYFMERLRKPR